MASNNTKNPSGDGSSSTFVFLFTSANFLNGGGSFPFHPKVITDDIGSYLLHNKKAKKNGGKSERKKVPKQTTHQENHHKKPHTTSKVSNSTTHSVNSPNAANHDLLFSLAAATSYGKNGIMRRLSAPQPSAATSADQITTTSHQIATVEEHMSQETHSYLYSPLQQQRPPPKTNAITVKLARRNMISNTNNTLNLVLGSNQFLRAKMTGSNSRSEKITKNGNNSNDEKGGQNVIGGRIHISSAIPFVPYMYPAYHLIASNGNLPEVKKQQPTTDVVVDDNGLLLDSIPETHQKRTEKVKKQLLKRFNIVWDEMSDHPISVLSEDINDVSFISHLKQMVLTYFKKVNTNKSKRLNYLTEEDLELLSEDYISLETMPVSDLVNVNNLLVRVKAKRSNSKAESNGGDLFTTNNKTAFPNTTATTKKNKRNRRNKRKKKKCRCKNGGSGDHPLGRRNRGYTSLKSKQTPPIPINGNINCGDDDDVSQKCKFCFRKEHEEMNFIAGNFAKNTWGGLFTRTKTNKKENKSTGEKTTELTTTTKGPLGTMITKTSTTTIPPPPPPSPLSPQSTSECTNCKTSPLKKTIFLSDHKNSDSYAAIETVKVIADPENKEYRSIEFTTNHIHEPLTDKKAFTNRSTTTYLLSPTSCGGSPCDMTTSCDYTGPSMKCHGGMTDRDVVMACHDLVPECTAKVTSSCSCSKDTHYKVAFGERDAKLGSLCISSSGLSSSVKVPHKSKANAYHSLKLFFSSFIHESIKTLPVILKDFETVEELQEYLENRSLADTPQLTGGVNTTPEFKPRVVRNIMEDKIKPHQMVLLRQDLSTFCLEILANFMQYPPELGGKDCISFLKLYFPAAATTVTTDENETTKDKDSAKYEKKLALIYVLLEVITGILSVILHYLLEDQNFMQVFNTTKAKKNQLLLQREGIERSLEIDRHQLLKTYNQWLDVKRGTGGYVSEKEDNAKSTSDLVLELTKEEASAVIPIYELGLFLETKSRIISHQKLVETLTNKLDEISNSEIFKYTTSLENALESGNTKTHLFNWFKFEMMRLKKRPNLSQENLRLFLDNLVNLGLFVRSDELEDVDQGDEDYDKEEAAAEDTSQENLGGRERANVTTGLKDLKNLKVLSDDLTNMSGPIVDGDSLYTIKKKRGLIQNTPDAQYGFEIEEKMLPTGSDMGDYLTKIEEEQKALSDEEALGNYYETIHSDMVRSAANPYYYDDADDPFINDLKEAGITFEDEGDEDDDLLTLVL